MKRTKHILKGIVVYRLIKLNNSSYRTVIDYSLFYDILKFRISHEESMHYDIEKFIIPGVKFNGINTNILEKMTALCKDEYKVGLTFEIKPYLN